MKDIIMGILGVIQLSALLFILFCLIHYIIKGKP